MMKEMAMIATGKKILGKFKSNFSRFTEKEGFTVVVTLTNPDGYDGKWKIKQFKANADNWLEELEKVDLGDWKVFSIEFTLDKAR